VTSTEPTADGASAEDYARRAVRLLREQGPALAELQAARRRGDQAAADAAEARLAQLAADAEALAAALDQQYPPAAGTGAR
jgi:hypothetical protein